MLNMIEESKSEVIALTTSVGLIQEDIAGIFDATFVPSQERNIKVQIITDVSMDNLKVVERLNQNITKESPKIKMHHINMSTKNFPRFLIKDEEEAILYAPFDKETSVLNLEDEGLWINDKMFISVLKAFFIQMWQSGVDVSRRIDELKSGIPIGETTVIKSPEEAWNKVAKVIESARKEVVIITSSQSINSLSEDGNDITKLFKKNLKVRLMASIDLDNLAPAQKLSAFYEVKHVPISYMIMMLVDNKHLFMFKNPSPNDLGSESAFYLADTFYSTDPGQIERVSEMLDDIWKRGIEISEIITQAGTKLPTVEVETSETIACTIDLLLKNNLNSVLITEHHKPYGVISDRDLLREILKKNCDPKKTVIKDLQYTPLIVLEKDESMVTGMKIMSEKGFKRAALVKNGQLIGMLTDQTAKKATLQMKATAT